MTDTTADTTTQATERRFGSGPLSRISALVYTLLVVEGLFLVTTLPGLVGLVLLDRDAGNVPLAALCLLPVGPALSAALYALRHHRPDLTDLRPAAAFWRGYRMNVRGVLKIWVPALAWLTVIAVNLANFTAAGVPGWWALLLVLIAVAAVLWTANALVITSLFEFRGRDIARLGVYFLFRSPRVTVGTVCLLIVAFGVTVVATEAVPALLASVFAAFLLLIARPMIDEVRERFTR